MDEHHEQELASLRARLAEEEERRRGRERDLVEQIARTREAEARLETVRQTMAFGLGQALVDALKLPGLVRLPARIVELRARQKEKRGWQKTHAIEERPAGTMRLVNPARTRAAAEGFAKAADWIEARPRKLRAAKARALVELAIYRVTDAPAEAAALGRRALALSSTEPRLVALATRLHEAGAVRDPLALIDALATELVTPAVARFRASLAVDAGLLAEGLVLPPPGAGHGEIVITLGDRVRDGAAMAAARAAGQMVTLVIGWLPQASFDAAGAETRRAADAWLGGMIAAATRVIARGPGFAEVAARLGAGTFETVSETPVAPPALETEACDELRRAFRLPADRIVVACPVVLDRDPGLALLVAVAARHPGIMLLFCASGPGAPLLARAASLAGSDEALVFTGALPPEQVAAALALADAIVLPQTDPAAAASQPAGSWAQVAGAAAPLLVCIESWRWRTIGDPPRVTVFDGEAALSAALDALVALR